MKRLGIKGLYAITPDEVDTAKLVINAELVLRGGASVLQYRNKLVNGESRLQQAYALRRLTRELGVTYIVNDDVELALQVDADGVHLGGEDGSIAAARARLGSDKIIGASCYNRAPLALLAVRQGADYVAFGAFFPSEIKPGAVKAELGLLQQDYGVPVVAIGGITAENGVQLIEAGADALAVISAVFAADDMLQAAQGFSKLFGRTKQ